MEFNIGDKIIGSNKCFIIAEIGQNHQGNIEIAKQMILAAKNCGVDCVKFQKSSLPDKFTASALHRSYTSSNSWASTYGAHKSYLEFSLDQFVELQKYANEINVLMSASPMDITSLHQLYSINVPFIKIGSGDTDNFQLLNIAAQHQTPLIISTGMQTQKTINKVIEIMQKNHKPNFCLLHCVSSYPTTPDNCNLRMIEYYREKYTNECVIGYSGHETGIAISLAAFCLGAKVIERHFTLDKNQKGTDHRLSLLPNEMKLLVDNIRHLENHKPFQLPSHKHFTAISDVMHCLEYFKLSDIGVEAISLALQMLPSDRKILPCELDCHMKLGKSLVYTKSLKSGHRLKYNDICCKVSEPKGIPASNFFEIVGMSLNTNVITDEIVALQQLI